MIRLIYRVVGALFFLAGISQIIRALVIGGAGKWAMAVFAFFLGALMWNQEDD